jgi:dihydrofolate reductase
VASRTLGEAGWPGTTILDGTLADEVRALKERHATIIVAGSSDLIQSLLREELADRIELFLHPITLGDGKRLFGDGTVPAAFRLTESATFDHGVALLSYEHAGRPAYGDMTELD